MYMYTVCMYMYKYVVHVHLFHSLPIHVCTCLSMQAKLSPTLKDIDFTSSGEKITIGSEAKAMTLKKLESDVLVCTHVQCN